MRLSQRKFIGGLNLRNSLLLLLFLATAAVAQRQSTDPNTSTAAATTEQTSAAKTSAASTDGSTQAAESSQAAKTSETPAAAASTSDAATTAKTSATSSKSTSFTGAQLSLTDAPTLTTSTTSSTSTTSRDDSTDTFTGSKITFGSSMPTIAGAMIPTPIVPDTSRAPFMQKSTLPEGTVFICVGAALGFMGGALLAWRGLVAWSLHRSVKRAAMAQNYYDSKPTTLRAPGGPYNQLGAGSTLSLDHLSTPYTHRPTKSAARDSVRSFHATPSNSSLFFSPTAGAGLHSASNRSSGYLPAGYYAPGASAPASGASVTHLGGPMPASPSPLSDRYSRGRSMGISPPGSPGLPPSRGTLTASVYDRLPSRGNESVAFSRSSMVGNVGAPGSSVGPSPIYAQVPGSTSSVNLAVPGSATGGRTPSAYLEDLFENHGNGPRERF